MIVLIAQGNGDEQSYFVYGAISTEIKRYWKAVMMENTSTQRKLQHGVYYGWVILLTISFTEITSWGILYYAFTVFLKPMQAELGWSTAQLTGAFSLALLCSAGAALPVGSLLDRHGTRWLMTIGSCAASLLLLAWAMVGNLILFYVIWAGIGIVMATVLYDPAFALVAVWFHKLRARALTILTFIAGFASVIFIPLAQWLIQLLGWRMALLALALLLALLTIPLHALILRRRPEDLGLVPDGIASPAAMSLAQSTHEQSIPTKDALHGATFWWIALAFALSTLTAGAITVHLIPYLIDEGYPASFAASMAGLIGIMALPGRLVFTLLGERLSRHLVIAILFLLQVVSLVAILLVPTVVGVLCFVVLFGAGFGAIAPARAAVVADHYGSTHYARINSVLGLFITGARAIAPGGAGIMYDFLGTYPPIFWALAGSSILATGAILLVAQSGEK
ncbi:MAG: MFS transporter [Ktedonobacteraceae bacterium]|nr:MFS transporter [Ktedonobacteraceae bacterium]